LSHEFRTPLASILGQADLLKDQDQDLTQGLLSIETNASHLLSLIDNILDQAKIDSGQMELRPAPTDLAHLTEQVKAIFSPIALQQGLELHIETSGLEGRFDIDALRLKQILINLLGNAVKFTQEGFVSLRIAVMNNRLSVAVADTGPGVSDAAKSRIFQAFHQEALHSSEGVGLGLAISFQLVQLMGGDLSVADREQGGSLFQFEILAPAATPMPAQTLGPALKILVADDSDDLRRLLLLHLEKGGHQTLEAANGAELLSLVDSAQPDMAIIDLYMGDEDGAELTRALRLRDYPGRILVLSASSMREDRQRVIDAGADAYLVKPVSAEALRRKVAELGRV
jgi:CheY-like chemotaxis protein